MIPIVAGYSLRNLLCGELAVIIRVQDICYRIRVRGHRFIAPSCLKMGQRCWEEKGARSIF